MSMFCYQCQETAGGRCCTVRGVCGKTEEVAKLQDLLIYTVKGISDIVVKGGLDVGSLGQLNREVVSSLFMTITNVNFDPDSIERQIRKMLGARDELRRSANIPGLHDAATFDVGTRAEMLELAALVGVLATEEHRSLRQMIMRNKGHGGICRRRQYRQGRTTSLPLYEALAKTLDDSLTADDLVALTRTGEHGVKQWRA